MRTDALPQRLILASSSVYRQQMLHRLMLPFDVVSPDIDETPKPGESPDSLARRLALTKARAVISRQAPKTVVIGADQVLELNGQSLGKPGGRAQAQQQLAQLSGQSVVFHSALAVLIADKEQLAITACRATFRTLTDSQINRYLDLDEPFDTAGSAKAESLGISLLTELQSGDPTAIIGLPLIELTRMLANIGMDPLDFAQPLNLRPNP